MTFIDINMSSSTMIIVINNNMKKNLVSPLGQTQKIIGRRTTPPAPATSED